MNRADWVKLNARLETVAIAAGYFSQVGWLYTSNNTRTPSGNRIVIAGLYATEIYSSECEAVEALEALISHFEAQVTR